MAIKDIKLSGKVRTGDGTGVSGAIVSLLETSAALNGTAHGTTDTTDSAGTWNFTVEGSTYSLNNMWDVQIASGDSKRYLAWSDEISLKGVDASYMKIRGITNGAAAPLYFIADRGDDNADIWTVQAAEQGAFTFESFISGSSVAQLTINPNSTVASSSVVFPGILDVNGSADFDVTDFDIASSGDIDLVSTNDAAAAIYLRENAGTSGTIKIHADQGTSVTEGASSIQLLSDAGGVELKSTANLAKSIKLIADGGTSETIYIQSDRGTSESSIQLLSDAGGIDIDAATGKDVDIAGGTVNLTSSDDTASAIYLRANAGTSETIKIHADQGTGAASIAAVSDAGGITLDAGLDIVLSADGGNVTMDDGTSTIFDFNVDDTTLTIHDDQDTGDKAVITMAQHGALSIETTDDDAAAANLSFIVDGAVDVDAAGAINLDTGSGIITFEDGGTEVLRLTEGNSGDVTVKLVTNAKDLIFTDNGDAEGFRILDAAAGVKVPGEVMTTKVSYTDGDDAMTIADGGGVTFAQASTFSNGITNSGTIAAGTWNGTAIATSYIADDAITSAKIADDAVVTAAIADDAITSALIADDAVGADELAANAVVDASVASGAAISVSKLALTAGDGLTLNTNDMDLDASLTTVTSILNASLVVGRDAHNDIDFTTDNTIRFRVGNEDQLTLTDGALTPSSNAIVDLGTDALEFKDAYFDGTLETDALTIGGTAILAQATAAGVGAVELATYQEIDTSEDASRVMTPDAFAASNYGLRYIQVIVVASGTAIAPTDGYAHIHIPAGLNGMDLAEVHAEVNTAPAGSTAIIEISKNGASTQMLSTNLTIDATETGSDEATAAVIKSDGTEAVATNDVVQVNVTQVGSTTAGSGLIVTLGFRIP